MALNFQSLIFWFFLPNIVGYVQSFLYSLTYRAGDPKPQPGSLKYVKHRRILHIGILVAYLAFSVYASHWELQREGNLYSSLGVPINVDDRGLASRFRRITAYLHPDKIADAQKRALAEVQYVKLKEGRDVLADTARRYAYDRIGPTIVPLEGKLYRTIHDFVHFGGNRIIYQYSGTLVVIALLHYFGINAHHAYWRYMSIVGLATLHGHMLTHSAPPAFLTYLNTALGLAGLNQLLPFEFMQILQHFTLSLFIALNQAGSLPPLPATRRTGPTSGDSTMHNHQQINHIINLTNQIGTQSQQLLEMESAPFRDEDTTREVAAKMKEWLVQNTLRNHETVRTAMGQHLARRRADAPTGARGTK